MGSSITEIPEEFLQAKDRTTQFDMKALKSSLAEKKTELAKLQKNRAPDIEIYYVMGQIELLKDLITAHGERAGGTRRRRRVKKQRRRQMTQRKRRS